MIEVTPTSEAPKRALPQQNPRQTMESLESKGATVAEALRHWASVQPREDFLLDGVRSTWYTFDDVETLTNRFAHNLVELGIGKGDRVVVFATGAVMTFLSMIGIWKAGAVFCPVNFRYGDALLGRHLDDLRPAAIIYERQLAETVCTATSAIYCDALHIVQDEAVDGRASSRQGRTGTDYESWEALATIGRSDEINIGISPYDIANIIYTSGTTGAAKGVIHTHRWINHHSVRGGRVLLTRDDVMYNDLPMYHVGGAMAAGAGALWAGSRLALWDKFSPRDFWNRIQKSGATFAHLVDIMAPWLMKQTPSAEDRKNTLNKLALAPIPVNHQQFAQRFGIDFIYTSLGQTESGVICNGVVEEVAEGQGTPLEMYKGYSHSEMEAVCREYAFGWVSAGQTVRSGYLGVAGPLVEAAVLDEHDEEVGPGVPGELVVRPRVPAILFQGYANKDEATVKAFRNLWYHTGDVVERDAAGSFYFVARASERIRHNGENVSSADLEALLEKHELVEHAAVFGIRRELGNDDICAYLILKKEAADPTEELRTWIEMSVPRFMWPEHIRVVSEFPVTPTNKVEKHVLRQQLLSELAHAVPDTQ